MLLAKNLKKSKQMDQALEGTVWSLGFQFLKIKLHHSFQISHAMVAIKALVLMSTAQLLCLVVIQLQVWRVFEKSRFTSRLINKSFQR